MGILGVEEFALVQSGHPGRRHRPTETAEH